MIEFLGGSKFRCLECDADLILDNGIIREPDSQVPHTWELCLENQVEARDRRMEQLTRLTEEIDQLRYENAILKNALKDAESVSPALREMPTLKRALALLDRNKSES